MMKTRNRSGRGVALLMSLSIILLLSIALMKTFENRSIEVAHLENSLQRFQAETLSRSIYRAVLIAIKTKGLTFIAMNKKNWSSFPIPLNETQYFQINKIKPIDHYFNLNLSFKPDDPRLNVFVNMVNISRKKKDAFADELYPEELYPVMSALNDWIDGDSDQDEAFLYGFEQYPEEELEFEVKNRAFDRISELIMIPPFYEIGFSKEDLKTQFRIVGKTEFIDINLAEKTDVEEFLETYKDVEGYPSVYDNRAQIADIISASEEPEGELNLLNPAPRFSPPLYSRGTSTWEQKLDTEGIILVQKEKDLFQATSDYLEIDYSVTVDKTTITVNSIVNISYSDKNKSTEINRIEILTFSMR